MQQVPYICTVATKNIGSRLLIMKYFEKYDNYHKVEQLGRICLQGPIFKNLELTECELNHKIMDVWILFSSKEGRASLFNIFLQMGMLLMMSTDSTKTKNVSWLIFYIRKYPPAFCSPIPKNHHHGKPIFTKKTHHKILSFWVAQNYVPMLSSYS